METTSALVGHTGFVGGALSRARGFGEGFNSRNFRGMAGCSFSSVTCAGVSAVKWMANREPEADRAAIAALAEVLATVRTDRFVLVSTVDVYPDPRGVDESSDPRGVPNHPYGTHRLGFEDTVRGLFPEALVVRLPGLFGEGLRKNVIHDMLRGAPPGTVDPEGRFQWYDVDRLADDIDLALGAGLRLANLAVEPIRTGDIIDAFFPGAAASASGAPSASYDMRTAHADVFDGGDGYVMDRAECLDRMGRFVAAERARGAVPARPRP